MHTFPAELEKSNDLPTCFSSHALRVLSVVYLVARYSVFSVGDLLCKMAPDFNAQVVFSVLSSRRLIALWRKIYVLDKLRSDMSYSTYYWP